MDATLTNTSRRHLLLMADYQRNVVYTPARDHRAFSDVPLLALRSANARTALSPAERASVQRVFLSDVAQAGVGDQGASWSLPQLLFWVGRSTCSVNGQSIVYQNCPIRLSLDCGEFGVTVALRREQSGVNVSSLKRHHGTTRVSLNNAA